MACTGLAVLLLAIELAFLPLPGIQQDEALFLKPFLRGGSAYYTAILGSAHLPIMLMDYVGGLKTWLYWPVFRIWAPGVWSIRVPVCFLSVGTLLLFAAIIRSVAGSLVALAAALLLATDASFALTNVFDWGPVSLLVFGAVAVTGLLVRFTRTDRSFSLAAASLLAGIMLWYKAIFAFPLAGIVIASLVVFPRQARRLVSPRRCAIGAGAFLIGLAPLLAFNVRSSGATLKAAGYIEHTSAREKAMMLDLTLNGKALEHYMFRSTREEILPLQGTPLGDLVVSWYRDSHLGPGSFLPAALLIGLAALPFIRNSQLFGPVAFAWVAALAMVALFFVSGSAGAGPHHTVLLLPAPQFIVVGTFAALAERLRGSLGRALLPGVVGVIAISNLLLFANYQRIARSNGFSVYWTDASRPLAEALSKQDKPVAFLDWGIEDPTRIELRDSIQVVDPVPARPGILYVTHERGYQISESATRGIVSEAASRGLVVSAKNRITDSEGRPLLWAFTLEVDRNRSPASAADSDGDHQDRHAMPAHSASPAASPVPLRKP